MAETNNNQTPIAPDDKFKITCPYCFNEVNNGKGDFAGSFPHTAVQFRAETFFENEAAIEKKLGMAKIDIEMMADETARKKALYEYELAERFMLKTDESYQKFWENYEGQTTEQLDRNNKDVLPWQRPIISMGDGATRFTTDADGFVTGAIDAFGKITERRVCPHCHNPLPRGFGKNNVKNIVIIGTTGAGKTVYISQLLKGMGKYAPKSGLSAFNVGEVEAHFIEDNMVAVGKPLPDSTSPGRLSQPMCYDIVKSDGRTKTEDTIVLYDIAGENCQNASSMVRFARFVKYSDGLILLIDPKQLDFVVNTQADDDIVSPATALITLQTVLVTEKGKKCNVPIAICVSKSDQCFDILPPIAQDQVQKAGEDINGMATKEFDGKSYNSLQSELKRLMMDHADEVCQILMSEYTASNFFAVSAIGCKCDMNSEGIVAPVTTPNPRRIEEPILWLFKQFGFIKSNAKVNRAFKLEHAPRYEYKKPLFGKAVLYQKDSGYSEFEEEQVRTVPQILKKGEWISMTEEYKGLEIKAENE